MVCNIHENKYTEEQISAGIHGNSTFWIKRNHSNRRKLVAKTGAATIKSLLLTPTYIYKPGSVSILQHAKVNRSKQISIPLARIFHPPPWHINHPKGEKLTSRKVEKYAVPVTA